MRYPDNLEFHAAINGLLAALTYPSMWIESFIVTSEECAEAMSQMMADIRECENMLGHIFPTTRAQPRENELFCHGQLISRFDYPELYAVLHPNFREGSNGIRLPDLRGRMPMGTNWEPAENFAEYSIEMAQRDGQQAVTLNVNNLPSHTHTTEPHSHVDSGHTHSVPNVIINIDVEAPGIPDPVAAGLAPPTTSGIGQANIQPETVTVNPTGNGTPHNNIPPVVGLNYVIVVR